jgi:hypothetical protein
MKKILILCFAMATLTSCGTICGGHVTDCQKTKPTDGTHRKIRPAALFFDIFCPVPGLAVIIDCITGGMYKPCTDKK